MRLTFTKSQFDVPVGKYLAQFDGVTLKDSTGRLDEKGKPMPPGMTWDFTILGGEHAGKKIDRLTGRLPTPKSACGKMLAAISDEVLKDGAEIDLGQFYGKTYRITVEEGNGDRTRLSDNPAPVRVYDTATAQPPQSSPGGGGFRRPTPKPDIPPAPADGSIWYVWDEVQKDWGALTAKEICEHCEEMKLQKYQVRVYPDGKTPDDAKTADLYGFPATTPF